MTNCVVSNNTFSITPARVSIWKITAANNTITRNTFIGNNGGIRLCDAGKQPIYLNNFEDNTTESFSGHRLRLPLTGLPRPIPYSCQRQYASGIMATTSSTNFRRRSSDGDGSETHLTALAGFGNDTAFWWRV